MWFFFLISSIAVYHIAFVNPRPENPSYTDFLSESNVAFNGLDESSLVPFDSSTQAPDFSASELLPLETDLYAESSDTLFDTLQIVDSSDELLQSSCETDDELQPYIKRDGEICAPKAAVEPLPLLKLPNLDDLEQIISSMRRERPNLQTHPISFIPGYSRDDELCPQPKRRLCCLGPLAGFVLTYDGWTLVRDCRGMMYLPLL